jgi:hypothetical protein
MPPVRVERVEHEWTIEWVIELWRRIHGGDPAPDEIDKLGADILVNLALHNIAGKLPTEQNGREIQAVAARNLQASVKALQEH